MSRIFFIFNLYCNARKVAKFDEKKYKRDIDNTLHISGEALAKLLL